MLTLMVIVIATLIFYFYLQFFFIGNLHLYIQLFTAYETNPFLQYFENGSQSLPTDRTNPFHSGFVDATNTQQIHYLENSGDCDANNSLQVNLGSHLANVTEPTTSTNVNTFVVTHGNKRLKIIDDPSEPLKQTEQSTENSNANASQGLFLNNTNFYCKLVFVIHVAS